MTCSHDKQVTVGEWTLTVTNPKGYTETTNVSADMFESTEPGGEIRVLQDVLCELLVGLRLEQVLTEVGYIRC